MKLSHPWQGAVFLESWQTISCSPESRFQASSQPNFPTSLNSDFFEKLAGEGQRASRSSQVGANARWGPHAGKVGAHIPSFRSRGSVHPWARIVRLQGRGQEEELGDVSPERSVPWLRLLVEISLRLLMPPMQTFKRYCPDYHHGLLLRLLLPLAGPGALLASDTGAVFVSSASIATEAERSGGKALASAPSATEGQGLRGGMRETDLRDQKQGPY